MKTIKSEQNFIVEVQDNDWFVLCPTERDSTLSMLREEAAQANCNTLTVFVVPDPILPIYGLKRRIKVHGEKLASNEPYAVSLTYHVELAPAMWADMEENEQFVLLREIRDGLAHKGRKNPGKYEIFWRCGDGVPNYVERGRV